MEYKKSQNCVFSPVLEVSLINPWLKGGEFPWRCDLDVAQMPSGAYNGFFMFRCGSCRMRAHQGHGNSFFQAPESRAVLIFSNRQVLSDEALLYRIQRAEAGPYLPMA